MPLPTNSYVPPFVLNRCPVVTLAEINTAWDDATDDDRAGFINRISNTPWGNNILYNTLTNVQSNDDEGIKELLVQVIESEHWFYSPDTPPPTPPVLTLSAMIDAFNGADSDDQNNFKNDIVDVPQFLQTFDSLEPQQLVDIVGDVLEKTSPSVKVVVPNVCEKTYTYDNETPPVAVPLQVVITTDGEACPGIGGGGDVNFRTDTITAEVCAAGGIRTTQDFLLSSPVDQAGQSGLAEILGLILLKQDQALRCCPPCSYSDPKLFTVNLTNYGRQDYQFFIDSISFSITVEGDPRYLEFSDPNIGRFARFAWVYATNGTTELEWINFNGEVKWAPNANCSGFIYACSAGVEMLGTVVYRDGVVRHWGIQ